MKQLLVMAVCFLSPLFCEDKFFRFSVDQDRLHGAPDYSFLNHPLGPADRIFVKDGHFYAAGADLKPHTADDQRVRFFGVNFTFAGLFPAEADAPRIAKRLRRLGVNLVRLHHMDSRPDADPANAGSILTTGPYPTINPISAARLRTFLDALKREGIYVNLNLKVGYRFRPEEDKVPPLPDKARMPFQSKPLHIFQPRMIELQREYAAKVIEALKLKNDPVLAMVEINNENSLLSDWQRGQLDGRVQGEYKDELLRQWNAFLKDKGGNVPLVANKDGAHARAEEYLRFLTAADRHYLRRMLAVVREKTDALVPVAGTQGQWAGGLIGMESHADMDYQDEHFYIDHVDFPNREWDTQDWRFSDDSSAGNGMTRLPALAASRQAGVPYTVSEYNQPWPNRQGAEINPTTAAFGAFQDWDAIMFFTYISTRDWDMTLPALFDLSGDWSKAVNMGQSAWLFRSGAISPGRNPVQIPIGNELPMRAARASRPGAAQFLTGAIGFDPAIALVHPVMLKRGEGKGQALPPRPSSPYRSDTGELVYDRAGKVFVIQAAQAAGVFGFPASRAVQAGDIAVECGAGARGFVSVLVTSLDQRAIRESGRLLVTTPGYTLGSRRGTDPPVPQKLAPYMNQAGWWTLEPDSPGKPSGDRSLGVAPVWMESVPATLTLRTSTAGVTVYPLDGAGTRMHPLSENNVKRVDGGFQIRLQAENQMPAPWYEIVAAHPRRSEFKWPHGAKAAVCLTYDDGIDVHLDHVIPDLEAAKLRGTFYISGRSLSVYRRMAEWREIVKRGHELGNHSMFHPCQRISPRGKVQDWITPERSLENYTLRQIAEELRAMNTTLRALDGKTSRTYAYTCGNYLVGGNTSFVDDIRPFFIGARTGGIDIPDPMAVDPFLIPSFAVERTSAEDMIGYVKRAVEKGGVATFMIHGVGGGHGINIERDAHQKLLAWLAAHRSEVWTDTFENVVQHMLAERKRLGEEGR